MSEQTNTCVILRGRNGQHEATVDAEDYSFLSQWRWSFKRSQWCCGGKIYARRCRYEGGAKYTEQMHVVILRDLMGVPCPSDQHTVDHINGNSLDNRRSNLRWATKREQSNNQRGRTPVFQTQEPCEVPF